MKAHGLLIVLGLLASPVVAQEQTRTLSGEVIDLVSRVDTLEGSVESLAASAVDIAGATRDLVLPVQEMIIVSQAAKVVKIELPADVLFDNLVISER